MREIKFRGQRIDNKEFVYGGYHRIKSIQYIIIGNGQFLPVKEYTVGQSTGLKDKNGIEIFGGDICLDRTAADKKAISRFIVIFENASFRRKEFYKTNWSGNETSVARHNFTLSEIGKYEVIGNIHQKKIKQ